MKIDFRSAYPELQGIGRPLRPDADKPHGAKGFGTLLGDLIPPQPEPINTVVESELPPILVPPAASEEARARLSLPHASVELPMPLPIQPKIEAEPPPAPPKLELEGVKAPAVLSVGRIPISVSGSTAVNDAVGGRSSEVNGVTPGAPAASAPERGMRPPRISPSMTKRMEEVRELVQVAGKKHGVDPVLGMAVVAVESSFNPAAVSSDGHASKGLFQLLDRTGRSLMRRVGMEGRYDPFNPKMNVDLGVNYLRYLHDIFSEQTTLTKTHATTAAANSASLEKLALAAFNAGEGRVAAAQQRAERAGKDPTNYHDLERYLPESTQQYVQRVMSFKSKFEGEEMV